LDRTNVSPTLVKAMGPATAPGSTPTPAPLYSQGVPYGTTATPARAAKPAKASSGK
jgi:hypothetical protein